MFCTNGWRQEKLRTQQAEAAAERQPVVAQKYIIKYEKGKN